MSQQIDDQSQSQSRSRSRRPPAPIPPALHLPSLTVRALMVELTEAEETLRTLEPFVPRNGRFVVNPARQPWIARERALVAELRARRTSWRRGELPGLASLTRRTSR